MSVSWGSLQRALLATAFVLLVPAHSPHAQSITSHSWDDPVTLQLANGRKLEGRYRGMLGRPRTEFEYAVRYERWRGELGPSLAPVLGESLVVFVRSSAPERGTFHGFVNRALLLGTADSSVRLLLPLGSIDAVLRADASEPDSSWTDVRRLWKGAPSTCVIAFQVGDTTLGVPATTSLAKGSRPGTAGDVVGGVFLGLIVGGVLASLALGAAMASAYSHF